MLEELERRNYAPSTIRAYIRTVEHFARHFHRSPDQLGLQHIRQYQAAMFRVWKLSPNTVTQRLAALRFLYIQVLKRGWSVAETPYPKKVLRLPQILSQQEVTRLLDAAESPFHRVLLMTLYATGARRAEAARLKITDTRSAPSATLPTRSGLYGIDIGKNTFHVVGLDTTGKPILHSKFRRDRLLVHFANTPTALIGMESCPGSQWLARKLQASGHTVKIIPAQFVKPYVKSNKNDMVDAAEIAEAVTRPTMRFVQVRQPEQSARQALHRVRDRYMSQRTGLINQMRGFLLEFGIALRQGAGVFRMDVTRVLEDETNELPPSMRTLLADLWNDFKLLEARIEGLSKQIQRSVQYSDTARRLMTVPGIGPLAASALEASAGNGHQFANGRFFAAWLGLTPREYSTGGKTTLLGISKRGNTYLRRILIHGARSCVQTCDRQHHPLGA